MPFVVTSCAFKIHRASRPGRVLISWHNIGLFTWLSRHNFSEESDTGRYDVATGFLKARDFQLISY